MSSGSPLYLQVAPSASPLNSVVQQHLEKEIANLVNSYRALDGQQLTAIAGARRVVVMGWRHSQTIAALIIRRAMTNCVF